MNQNKIERERKKKEKQGGQGETGRDREKQGETGRNREKQERRRGKSVKKVNNKQNKIVLHFKMSK
jgi:hypothetical protein